MKEGAESLKLLKSLAANVKAGKCVECKWFRSAEDHQKFNWFGLRKDVETSDSIYFGKCAAHFGYAKTARNHDCKGKDWEPK